MTPLQGEPPKVDFPVPRRWKKWMTDLRRFVIECQPIPGRGVTVIPYPRGRQIAVTVESLAAAGAAISSHPLQLVDATTGTTPAAAIRVRYGEIGGQKADTDMDTDDDPVFSFSVSGAAVTKFIYCTVTMQYNTGTGVWSRNTGTANEISAANSIPAATATAMRVAIGTATVVSADGGGYRVSSISQTVSGNQWIARIGNGTTYVDANGLL